MSCIMRLYDKFFAGRSLVFNCVYASRFDSFCRTYRIASRPLRKNSMLPTSLVTKITFIRSNVLCKLYRLESEQMNLLLCHWK
jgi:hypothetical protein